MLQRLAHHAPQLPDSVVAGGVATIIGSLAADAFAPINVVLVIAWAVAMFFDFFFGVASSISLGGLQSLRFERFARGLMKRIAMAGFYVAALLADALLSLLPGIGAAASLTPVTKSILVMIICYEILSIARNSKAATGFALPFELIAQTVRQMDRTHIGGQEPPTRRHYDPAALEAAQRTDPHDQRPGE